MQTRIQGTTMPVLEVQLDPNESVFSESGELSWMTQSIQMTTHTQMGGGGGLFGVFKRIAGGGSIFMTEYRAWQYPGEVAFATKVPGHIVPVQLGQGYEYMVHRHGFLCATPQVTISVGFQQSLGAGIFGGDGFLLQKVERLRNGLARTLRRADHEGSRARRDAARASGPRGRVHVDRLVPDHHGARHQEHDLRRRWHFPGATGRAGPRLAADPADFAAGASDRASTCRTRAARFRRRPAPGLSAASWAPS